MIAPAWAREHRAVVAGSRSFQTTSSVHVHPAYHTKRRETMTEAHALQAVFDTDSGALVYRLEGERLVHSTANQTDTRPFI